MTLEYRVVIGLEIHVQLATQSKLFCGCSVAFGAEPNTQTCPVCTGMPGTLPVMNQEAVRLARLTGLALNCELPAYTKWDRKQYYYPDLPKGYQISQYDLPLCQHGYLDIPAVHSDDNSKRVRILRAHLEDDAGKSQHDEAHGMRDSQIDLNRCGTPLLEIVTEPDLSSAKEARAFLNELKLLLSYIDVSDCNMQEGSLRVDANINLHIPVDGEVVATPIVEIKNMNSFRAVEAALSYEQERQIESWEETGAKKGDVPKQTRGWDDSAGVTRPQRSKEESSDYRYFPDPDLVPVTTNEQIIEKLRSELPSLPPQLRQRLEEEIGLSPYDADVLVNQGRGVVDYFENVARLSKNSKAAANWVTQDVLRVLKEDESTIDEFAVSSDALAELIQAIDSSDIPGTRGRDVFAAMLQHCESAAEAARRLGIEAVDQSELEALCRELLAANAKIVADVQQGNTKAVGALIGQAKKQNPNVDPNLVRMICLRLIEKG